MSEYPLAQSIDELLQQIKDATADGDYIFRGENADYKTITSTLYRQYDEYEHIEVEHLNLESVQQEMLKEAKQYAPPDKTDDQILTDLQHYGGNTNLIDFTRDYCIALFFACDGKSDEDGRLILFNRITANEDNRVITPASQNNRVLLQKSIFVSSKKGYLKDGEVKIIEISSSLKDDLLEHIHTYHGISTKTIYKDILGYIQLQKTHVIARIEFHIGNTKQAKGEATGDSSSIWEAMRHYDKAIKSNSNFADAYCNRGNAKTYLGQLDEAIKDYNAAIALNPHDADYYNNRGAAQMFQRKFDNAISDFNTAIKLNPNLASAYNNRGYALYKLKKYKESIVDYCKAIETNSQYANPFFNRGLANQKLANNEKAREDYEHAMPLAKQQGDEELVKKIQAALNILDNLPPK